MTRARVSITLDDELLKWVNDQVETKYQYRDRSHFIECAIHQYKENIRKVKTSEDE